MREFDHDLRVALGNQLKDLRESTGLSRHRMAQQLGYTYAKLSMKETGVTPVNIDDLITYGNYFDIHPSDLISIAEQLTFKRRTR
jgi:transcriptional regulator with XRE-family HTH domain